MTTLELVNANKGLIYKISKQYLLGKKKNKEIVEPRMICIYLICELLDLPLVAIGKKFGDRDHTTIMHASHNISPNKPATFHRTNSPHFTERTRHISPNKLATFHRINSPHFTEFYSFYLFY